MSTADYELVARVGKARGLEGEVTATSAGDLPFCVFPGLRVFVVPPTLYGPRELTVESVEEGPGTTYHLRFEGVDSIESSEQLAGRFLLAKLDDLDFIDDAALHEIGRLVIDERFGTLGRITEIIETPANDVWVIHGERGEVLVPVIDEVIVDYPEDDEEPICTHIMDGLIDA